MIGVDCHTMRSEFRSHTRMVVTQIKITLSRETSPRRTGQRVCAQSDLHVILPFLPEIEHLFMMFPGARYPQTLATADRAPRGAGLGLPALPAPRGRSGLRGPGQPAGLSRASAMRSTLETGGAAP